MEFIIDSLEEAWNLLQEVGAENPDLQEGGDTLTEEDLAVLWDA